MSKRARDDDTAAAATGEQAGGKRVRVESAAAAAAVGGGSGSKTTKEMLRTSITSGPFSLLDSAMRENARVFVQCRFNKSLLGSVVAFDKHFNLVLYDVIELSAREHEQQKPRSIRNLFLRGESVIFIVKMSKDGQ